MGYSKPYAKKCKYCNTVQVVWDEHLDGPNKFKEVQTNQQHTRERCDAAKNTPVDQQVPMYNPREQKEFVDMYRPQQQQAQQQDDFKMAQLITKVDNMNIALAQIMSNVSNIIENAGTFKEMQQLKTENQQLKEIIKREGLNLKTANQIQSQSELDDDEDDHIARMVQKGKADEELEI